MRCWASFAFRPNPSGTLWAVFWGSMKEWNDFSYFCSSLFVRAPSVCLELNFIPFLNLCSMFLSYMLAVADQWQCHQTSRCYKCASKKKPPGSLWGPPGSLWGASSHYSPPMIPFPWFPFPWSLSHDSSHDSSFHDSSPMIPLPWCLFPWFLCNDSFPMMSIQWCSSMIPLPWLLLHDSFTMIPKPK